MQVAERTGEIVEGLLVSTPVQLASSPVDDVDQELRRLQPFHRVEGLVARCVVHRCHFPGRVAEVPRQTIPLAIHMARTARDLPVTTSGVRVVKMFATRLDHQRRRIEEAGARHFFVRAHVDCGDGAIELVQNVNAVARIVDHHTSGAFTHFDGIRNGPCPSASDGDHVVGTHACYIGLAPIRFPCDTTRITNGPFAIGGSRSVCAVVDVRIEVRACNASCTQEARNVHREEFAAQVRLETDLVRGVGTDHVHLAARVDGHAHEDVAERVFIGHTGRCRVARVQDGHVAIGHVPSRDTQGVR